jgi:adenylate cyclase
MTSVEKATEYLGRVNWKSLIEWLTAEAILNRPHDPMQYCRDLLGSKLAERGGADFRADQVTDWLRGCYTEATSLVDEHGVIHGKDLEVAEQTMQEQLEDMRHKTRAMQKLLDASRSIASLDPSQATDNIVAETCRILDCDRATIFTLDNVTQELVLSVAEGASNIRVPLGQGIAGTVAATGETINITDAYSDPRFSSSADKATGYRTNTILCHPIKGTDGTIIGVLQAINKNDGLFSSIDVEVMNTLSLQAGIALLNARLFANANKSRDKFRSLLDIISAMQGQMGVNSLIFTITQRTTRVVDADRCTLYLVDNVQRGLFAMQGEVNIRISMEQGIAGHVATSGEVLNIPDAYDHPQFNQAIDKKSGYRTKAILCMPIKKGDTVIGVIQLINKMDGTSVFNHDDESVMAIFLSIAGPILADSTLYLQIQGKSRTGKSENKAMEQGAHPPTKTAVPQSMPALGEDEEDEEDEEE